MDQYLSVIKYLFNKAGFEENITSIDSFFDDGCSFPRFIAIIFNIDKVPETNEKPFSNYFKQLNNKLALQYLFKQNNSIKKISPKYETKSDKINLIKLIFANQCFKMKQDDIMNTSNLILKPYNLKFYEVSEMMNENFLFTLLNVLTKNKEDISKQVYDNNFNTIIESFQEALIPLLIDQNTLKSNDNLLYLIQLQVIFDIFSDKINIIIRKSQRIEQTSEKTSKLVGINPNITINDDSIDKNDKLISKTYKKEEFIQEKNIFDKFLTNSDIENKFWYPQEKQEDSAMLLTINLIAYDLNICKMNECDSFEFTLFNNFIPLFVMRYRNIKSIPNIKKIKRSKEDPLTYQEIKNIKLVIEYLKKEEKSFELLLFDFDSPFLFVNSAKLFFRVFLNTYFVKNTRIEMMERCNNLIGDLKWYSKEKIFTKRRYDTFTGLLSFINLIKEKKINSNENTSYDYFIDLSDLFEKTNVPRIITMDIMDDFYHDSELPDSLYYQQSDKELPNSIMYQLQLIFDKIDSLPGLKLAETLRIFNHKIKKIIIPQFNTIKSIVKSKIQGLKLKSKITKIDLLKEEQENEKQLKLNKPITFVNRHNTNDNFMKNSEKKSILKNNHNLIDYDSIKYWNPSNTDYKIKDGILYSNEKANKSTIDFIKCISKSEDKIKNKMGFKSHKKSSKILDPEKPNLDLIELSHKKSGLSFDTHLYKLFYFDETKFRWIFNSELFDSFSIDKKINVEGSRTPLIFYFNSNEKDLITINSNFVIGSYPKLEDDQIFIYPLCERNLSRLNTVDNFSSPEIMSTKPIFLLLHVPKEKENLPFVHTAIYQIYSFLSFACDLTICIYNDNYISNQIDILKDILQISNSSFAVNQNNLEIMLLKNCINCEYKYYDKNLLHQLSVLKLQNNDTSIPINLFLCNLEEYETYKPFIDYFTDVSLNSKTTFSIVKNIFNDFNCCNLSELYLKTYFHSSWKEEIKRIIKDRFLKLKSNDPNFEKNPEIALSKLHDEFTTFAPMSNFEFQNECNINYNLMRKTFTKQNNSVIIEELKKSSDENIKMIKKMLFSNENDYWTKNQIENIIINHTRFLKNEYLNIIKSTSDVKLIHLIYQDNLEILNSQIEADKKIIDDFKKSILVNFKAKNTIKTVDANESIKKGTNYTLKETENIREIEISVVNCDDLKNEIEQDF